MSQYGFRLVLCTGLLITGIPAAHAFHDLPTFQCMLSDQPYPDYDRGVDYRTFHHATTHEIFLICESNNVVIGDNIRAVWIADNTIKPVLDNVLIKERKRVVLSNLNDLDLFKARFAFAEPCNGWPIGEYHIRLYINNIEADAYHFDIR